MIAGVRVLVHAGERVRGHRGPGAAEAAAAAAVVMMGLQRRRVAAVVLRGAAVMVLVDSGRGGRREVRVTVRMVHAAHVVRVLLELDEGGLGRRYGRYAAHAATAAAGLLPCSAAAAGRPVPAGAVGAAAGPRTESRGVHRVTAGHRRRRARGSLLLLLLVCTTAAPSERAPDLSVIQRDGCRVLPPDGIVYGV